MIAKYTVDLPIFTQHPFTEGRLDDVVVLLTGSTGSLGSHILAALLQEPKVKAVYTLDRGLDPRKRLRSSFQRRGLPLEFLDLEKLHCLNWDMSKPDFGLDPSTLTTVCDAYHYFFESGSYNLVDLPIRHSYHS